MLELQHIHKMYNPGTINEICLFEDFNLKIEDGQFVSVVGSNVGIHGQRAVRFSAKGSLHKDWKQKPFPGKR